MRKERSEIKLHCNNRWGQANDEYLSVQIENEAYTCVELM